MSSRATWSSWHWPTTRWHWLEVPDELEELEEQRLAEPDDAERLYDLALAQGTHPEYERERAAECCRVSP